MLLKFQFIEFMLFSVVLCVQWVKHTANESEFDEMAAWLDTSVSNVIIKFLSIFKL